MKKIERFTTCLMWMMMVIPFVFASCSSDEPSAPAVEKSVTVGCEEVTCYSAKIIAQANEVTPNAECGVLYSTDSILTSITSTKIIAETLATDGSYTVQLTGLSGATTYYYCSYARQDGMIEYGNVLNFTTLADNVVETGDADDNGMIKSKSLLGEGAYSSVSFGLCYSDTTAVPTINHSCIEAQLDAEGYFTAQIPGMGTFSYRAYAIIDGVAHYGEVKKYEKTWNLNGHEAVDLGLPSETLWAACNVGASKPQDCGNYYAWGETEAKANYSWSTYKWCNGKFTSIFKYTTEDGKFTLDIEDDAARANMGGDWRTPTEAEQSELAENCTWSWTEMEGVKGYEVTGPNGNKIFLPAAGCYYITYLRSVGEYGYYASNAINPEYICDGCGHYFTANLHAWYNNSSRCIGLSVRAVIGGNTQE